MVIHLPSRQIFFYKKETEKKNELAARPGGEVNALGSARQIGDKWLRIFVTAIQQGDICVKFWNFEP